MTETWHTAAEFAQKALPGLPTTERRIRDLAQRQNWPSRDRRGRGGGREYPVSALPEAARTALAARSVKVDSPAVKPAPRKKGPGSSQPNLAGQGSARLDAWGQIFAAWDAFQTVSRLPKLRGIDRFCGYYTAGEIDVENWVRRTVASISPATMRRKLDARAKNNWGAVSGQYGNRKGTGFFDRHADVAGFVQAFITQSPTIPAKTVHAAAKARFGDAVQTVDPESGETVLEALPGARTFCRYIQRFQRENPALFMAATNPDKYRSQYRFAAGSLYADITDPNQLWELDASPADVMCTDGRYKIVVMGDVATRRLKARVTKTPTADASLLLAKDTILDWGVPQTIRTDNGSEFVADRVRTALALLDIRHDICPPYAPERRGFIERHIGIIQHEFMALQPGFVGHDVADRKAIEERRAFADRLGVDEKDAFCVQLSAAELQDRLDQWISNAYMHRPHQGLDGKTPWQAYAESAAPVKRLEGDQVAARHLHFLLAEPADGKARTVTKKGLRVNNIDYYSPEVMPGERVLVRLDSDDLSRIYCYRENPFEFIAVAENPEYAGVSRQEVAATLQARQKKITREGLKDIRRNQKEHNVANIGREIAAAKAGEHSSLVAFPKREEVHDSDGLRAAAEAAAWTDAQDAPPPERTDVDAAIHAEVVADFQAARQERLVHQETSRDRFRFWLKINKRIESDLPVSEDEHRQWQVYQESPEFKALWDFYEEYGERWLNTAG